MNHQGDLFSHRPCHLWFPYAFEYDGFVNQTAVKARDRTLERYSYAPNNGPLITIT
ncbi:hypothetical protein OCV46_02045 [Anthropogastromicrobium aceti]|nr:hypothetical protein [Anthropogastromicrobium aceti]